MIDNTKTKDGFIRDNKNPGAVLNTNNEALENYKKAKKRFGKIDELEERIGNIEILLKEILKKL